jgi:hypothetical protein
MSALIRTTARSGEVAAYLDKLKAAAAPRPAGRGRLIFALDATASRAPAWDRACRLQAEMFEATAALGGLDLQLVYYRGMGAFAECKAGHWVTTAAELHRLMRGVSCVAGETQIARVLDHALRVAEPPGKLGALIFIGDDCEEGSDALVGRAGRLGALGIPVFVFWERGQDPHHAEPIFEALARASGGACLVFDAASAERLKVLLGSVAVYVAGGRAALEAYGRNKRGEVLRLTHQLRER